MLLSKSIFFERADMNNKLRVNVSASIKPINSIMDVIWISAIRQSISSPLKPSGDQTNSTATISCSYPQLRQIHATVIQPSISDVGSVSVVVKPTYIRIVFGNCNNLPCVFNYPLWENNVIINNISIVANIDVSLLNRQQRRLMLDNMMCDFLQYRIK